VVVACVVCCECPFEGIYVEAFLDVRVAGDVDVVVVVYEIVSEDALESDESYNYKGEADERGGEFILLYLLHVIWFPVGCMVFLLCLWGKKMMLFYLN
jgi:hypothetical protein